MQLSEKTLRSQKNDWLLLIPFLAIVFAIELISGFATYSSVHGWYQEINKPVFTPPDWVFGPVWTVLYVMIAASGWRAWIALREQRMASVFHRAMQWYGAQLVLNLVWSLLFFGMQWPEAALLDLGVLIIAIALTIRAFGQLDSLAALLLTPYLVWCWYAMALNMGIVWLN